MSLLSSLLGTKPTANGKDGKAAANDTQIPSYTAVDYLQAETASLQFKKDMFRIFVKANIILSSINIVGIVSILVIVLTASPTDRFFTTSVTGRNERIYPADEPFDAVMTDLIAQTVSGALIFSYQNYQMRFGETRTGFAKEAFDSLITQITGSGGMDAVRSEKKKFDVEFAKDFPPQLVSSDLDQGLIYRAVIDIPLMVSVTSDLTPDKVAVTPYIVRVQALRNIDLSLNYPFTIQSVQLAPAGPTEEKEVVK